MPAYLLLDIPRIYPLAMSCIFLKSYYVHFTKYSYWKANNLNLRSFFAMGALGTGLHLLMDTPLYEDIKLFYPIMTALSTNHP